MKREFLQLAHTRGRQNIDGWYMSEKRDGQRALWDGGFTGNMNVKSIPFANTEKNARYRSEIRATGLWTRYANVIHAPESFIKRLPQGVMLDGELLIPGASRQELRSVTSKLEPSEADWKDVIYYVFQSPPMRLLFADGRIEGANCNIKLAGCYEWARATGCNSLAPLTSNLSVFEYLNKLNCWHDQLILMEQTRLERPFVDFQIERELNTVVDRGGEGLIVVNPFGYYQCGRTHDMLKIKPEFDAEAVITGFISGKRTDKGSKLLGLIGALVTCYEDKILRISGIDHGLRILEGKCPHTGISATDWASLNPGQLCPLWVQGRDFEIGETITFKYRGKSLDGIPQEARYWRKYEHE